MPESGRLPALAAARLGGAPVWPAVRRITGRGVLALALSVLIGKLAGVAV